MSKSTKPRVSFVTAALNAALEDFSETVKPKGEATSEVTPEQVTALSNGEGPQAALDGDAGKTVPAVENELPGASNLEGADGDLQIQEDLEDAVRATVALESISEALMITSKTKTATLASNTGFSMAIEIALENLGLPNAIEGIGLESEDLAGGDQGARAEKLAKWAMGKAAALKQGMAAVMTAKPALFANQINAKNVVNLIRAGSARGTAMA